MKYGVPIDSEKYLDYFEASEGTIDLMYGRIGQGKTYNSTADVREALMNGEVVYANWPMNWDGYDQRDSFKWRLRGLLGLKQIYFSFPKENLRFYEISDEWARKQGYADFIDWFASRTDCKIFADEGHALLDSYQGTKMPIEKRMAILHTRHFNRSIIIISQRPTAVHVSARGNVNRFFKCEKLFHFFGIIIFRKSEYQDMTSTGETVDEEIKPISTKWYFASKKVFAMYDTKYLRRGMSDSQRLALQAFKLTYVDRVRQSLDKWLLAPTRTLKRRVGPWERGRVMAIGDIIKKLWYMT